MSPVKIYDRRNAVTSTHTSFVDGSLTAGVLSIAHNLGRSVVSVSVYNNSSKEVTPDDITIVDADNVTVDLSSWGTITGTWSVVVLG